jgi:hypothetical protein
MAIRPSDRSILNRAASCAATLVLAIGIVHAADAPSGVVVNGQALPAATVRTLEQAYRVPIAPGRYWYDAVSGAWGSEGGAIAGQMVRGLRLGGPLAADASRGNSQVFINSTRRGIAPGPTSGTGDALQPLRRRAMKNMAPRRASISA